MDIDTSQVSKNLEIKTSSLSISRNIIGASNISQQRTPKQRSGRIVLAKFRPQDKEDSNATSDVEKKEEEIIVVPLEAESAPSLLKRLSLTLSKDSKNQQNEDATSFTTTKIPGEIPQMKSDNLELHDAQLPRPKGKQEAAFAAPRIKRDTSNPSDEDSVVDDSDSESDNNKAIVFSTASSISQLPRPAGGTQVVRRTATPDKNVQIVDEKPTNSIGLATTTTTSTRSRSQLKSTKSVQWAPDPILVVETRAKTQYKYSASSMKWRRRKEILIACLKREKEQAF